MSQVLYFVRRIDSFKKDGLEPPQNMRVTIRCDTCRESCWANKENWKSAKTKYTHAVICDVCMRDGRHRTG